jgi:hypothetical protein
MKKKKLKAELSKTKKVLVKTKAKLEMLAAKDNGKSKNKGDATTPKAITMATDPATATQPPEAKLGDQSSLS